MTKTYVERFVLSAVAVACSQAHALGFGHVASDVPLGQPLALVVPVHVEPTEHFGSECVRAQVMVGDAPVSASQVRTSVMPGKAEGEWLVRIGTTFAVEEPVVEVTLDAGCGQTFSRKFTAFANPTTPAVVAEVPGTRADAAGQRAEANAAAAVASAKPRGRGKNAPARQPEVAARVAAVAAAAPATTNAAAAGREQGARLVLDSGFGGPRLKMDLADPVIPPEGAGSAPAVAALAEDIGSNTQSLQGLQNSIAQMRRETRADRARTAALEAQLAEARESGNWTPWLLGLLGVCLAAAAALGWRLRRVSQAHAHSRWFTDSQLAPPAPAARTLPAPEAATLAASAVAAPTAREPERPLPTIDVAAVPVVSGSAPAIGQPEAPASPAPAPAAARGEVSAGTPTEVSVEELLDLEQQADFFIALGQEDAAIDLLMAHLRSAGGQSPLPYTKLLEIYRRQGDRAAYERTRARFNRRFNAYAPDWETGPGSGRPLEDYPDTVEQVQGAWIAPIDAMAILEALLFRRDESSELFDLPAYRDVLLLYAIARDLWQQGAGAGGSQIDVLLPMDPSGVPPAFEPTARGAFGLGEEAGSPFETPFEEATPSAYALPALDTMGAGTPSAFGDLHATLHLEPQLLEPTHPGLPTLEENDPGTPDKRRR